MTGMWLWSFFVLWGMVIVLCVAVFALYHHFGEMYVNSREGRGAHGPGKDMRLKRVTGVDIYGREHVIPPEERPAIIVFSAVNCQLCEELKPGLPAFAEAHPDIDTFVVCNGRVEQVAAWATDLGSAITTIGDRRGRLAAAYGIGITPFVVVADRDGIVRGRGIINQVADLEAAAEDALLLDVYSRPLALAEGQAV